jgi:toxin-antitoxin system PIN domain toxin
MISFFPDLNVWLALSVAGHSHSAESWNWLNFLPRDARIIFSRYTQIGLLRLLANSAAMGEQTLTVEQAWGVYERWLRDPRVELHPEPRGLDMAFRQATEPFAAHRAARWIGDCYLIAYARQSDAALATFDKALLGVARKYGCAAIRPG